MPKTIRVIGNDGQLVGRLSHVVAERGAARATGIVIAHERDGAERVLPISEVFGAHGELVTLAGDSTEYRDLPPFVRTSYRVIDEEIEMREQIDEDFQVGADDTDERGHEADTAGGIPPRGPVRHHAHDDDGSMARDASDQDDGREPEVAARTRREMQ